MEPPGSEDPALEKFTVRGTGPLVGEAEALAVGGWLVPGLGTVPDMVYWPRLA
jgi:hypothetical protein